MKSKHAGMAANTNKDDINVPGMLSSVSFIKDGKESIKNWKNDTTVDSRAFEYVAMDRPFVMNQAI